MSENLADRLEAIKDRRDDMVTIEEIGIDQVIVDEAQEFRKLSFATNRLNLKGVDPDGSQRAWDLCVKTRFIDGKNPRRALIQASGTPITNTLGEMFTLLRFQNEQALRERGVHEFDAWAAAFGDTRTELELQPSGTYKPVERFSQFVNVPELIDMFRSCADVVLKDDLRQYLRLPRIRGGKRELITAEASDAFRDYQRHLADRIAEIESRTRRVQKGDDILLTVITDGRHAAIDMRLVWPGNDNEPENKLNKLIANVHRIWVETGRPLSPAGRHADPDPRRRTADLLRSRHPRVEANARLLRLSLDQAGARPARRSGVTKSPIIQDYKRTADKQRLFNDFNAGRVRVLIGSPETMGTGANVQRRLKAAASPRCALAALPYRAAGGPDRAARQPVRRDRDLRLCHARLDGRHHVAEQRAQGPLHRRRPLRRSQHPHDRRHRRSRQPVRAGQSHRIGRRAPDAESRS